MLPSTTLEVVSSVTSLPAEEEDIETPVENNENVESNPEEVIETVEENKGL